MVSSVDRKKARSKTANRSMGANRAAKSTAAKATLALKLARSLVKDVEHKTWTFSLVSTAPLAAPVFHISAIPENTTSTGRIGHDLNLKDFELRATLLWNVLDTTSITQRVRLVMFIDKQQQPDTTPTAALLMGNSLVNTHDLTDRTTVPSRFKVIKDQVWILHNPIQTSAGNVGNGQGVANAFLHWKFPFKLKQRYNGANGGDVEKNGVYLMLSSGTTTNPPNVTAEGRFNFTG